MSTRSVTLRNEIAEVLGEYFKGGHGPTRKIILETIQATRPDLNHGKLDLEIATHLNALVDLQLLSRSKGKFYVPGEKLGKEKGTP